MGASLGFLSYSKMMELCLAMSFVVLLLTAGLPSPCSLSAFPSELQPTSFSGNKNHISL